VFLAACHSEQAKKMFLEVGAEHVISIDEKKVIEDLAILSFTKTFYDRIWKTNSTICGAFH